MKTTRRAALKPNWILCGLLLLVLACGASRSAFAQQTSTIITPKGSLQIAQGEEAPQEGSSTARMYEEAARSREAAARIWEDLGNRVKAADLWNQAAQSWAEAAKIHEAEGYTEAALFANRRFQEILDKLKSYEVTLEILSGNNQTQPILSLLPQPIVIQVKNSEGKPVPGISLTTEITQAPLGGKKDLAIEFPEGNETGDDGRILIKAVLGSKAGFYQIAFRAEADLSAKPVYLNITAQPLKASRLEIVGDPNRALQVNRQTTQPLTVSVSDAYGNPVSGVTIRFRVVEEPNEALGTQLLTPENPTNENGVAGSHLMVGNAQGTYLILAESAVPLEGSPARFTVSAVQTVPMITLKEIRFEGTEEPDFYQNLIALEENETYLVTHFQDAVSEAVESIYRSGRIKDVQTLLDEDRGQGILTFRIKERPRIESVNYEGIDKLGEDEARQGIDLAPGQYYSEFLVNRARAQLLQNYEEKGYLDAGVTVDTAPSPRGGVDVTFHIQEEDVIKISQMIFHGNTVFSDWSLNWHMKTGRWKVFDQKTYDQDRQKILGRYYDRGYLTASMSDVDLRFNQEGKLEAHIYFNEGPQFRLGTVEYTGHTAVATTDLQDAFGRHLSAGEIFNRSKFAEALEAIRNSFTRLGYMEVDIRPEDFLDYENSTVSFILQIEQGDILYLEAIELSGNTLTRDEVILREVLVKPGQILNGELLDYSQKRLINLGFFEEGSVQFRLRKGSAPNRRILEISVVEGKTGELTFGAGYSSVDKLVGFLSITKDNFDPTAFWSFTGDGQKITLSLEGSSRRTSYNLSWTDPWWRDQPISVGFDLFRTFSEREFTDQEAQGGGAWVGWSLGRFDTFRVGYRYTRTDVEDINVFSPESVRREAQFELDPANNTSFSRQVSMISTEWTRDTRNSYRFPTEGYRLNMVSDLAAGFLGGNVDFWRPILTGSYYKGMPWDPDHVFAARAQIATITNFFNTASYVPDYERFYLGGPNSVRGYGSRELAIYSPNGTIISGGGSEFFFNLEYRIQLVENTLTTVAFVDGGMIDRRAWQWDPANMAYGAGVGIRLTTPLGPIRLDWGYGLNEPNKNQSELHFAMGTSW